MSIHYSTFQYQPSRAKPLGSPAKTQATIENQKSRPKPLNVQHGFDHEKRVKSSKMLNYPQSFATCGLDRFPISSFPLTVYLSLAFHRFLLPKTRRKECLPTCEGHLDQTKCHVHLPSIFVPHFSTFAYRLVFSSGLLKVPLDRPSTSEGAPALLGSPVAQTCTNISKPLRPPFARALVIYRHI